MPSKVEPRILKAAAECFAETGFAGTSTREIAKAADVAEVTIFRRFQNKENLFAAALDWSTENWRIPTSESEKALNKENLEEAIRCACKLHIAKTNPGHWRLRLYASLEGKQITLEQREWALAFMNAIRKRLDRAVAEGVAKPSLNTYYAASQLVACLFSMWIFSGINDDEAYDPKQAVDDYLDGWVSSVLSHKTQCSEYSLGRCKCDTDR